MTALANEYCPTCGQTFPPPIEESEFDEFWAIYPARPGKRKIGKSDAMLKWRKLSPQDRQTALEAAQSLAKAVRDGYRYPIDAHRFLTNKRWQDWLQDAPVPAPERPPWAPPNAVPDGQGGWQS